MNVKPGDLAILTRNTTGTQCFDSLIGAAVVKVSRPTHFFLIPLAWHYEGDPYPCARCGIPLTYFYDADLTRLAPLDDQEPMTEPAGIDFDEGVAHA